jgi:hypothetical protein
VGDLRISQARGDENVLMLAGGGVFQPLVFGVFTRRKQQFHSLRHVMVHEIEHAQHHSLWHLAQFPVMALGHETAEYLAMLRTIWFLGEAPILMSWRNKFLGMKPSEGVEHTPHHASAMSFARRLRYRYFMSGEDVARAAAFCARNHLLRGQGNPPDHGHLDSFLRLQAAAQKEYARIYGRLFGMPLDDLCDVVSQLSP